MKKSVLIIAIVSIITILSAQENNQPHLSEQVEVVNGNLFNTYRIDIEKKLLKPLLQRIEELEKQLAEANKKIDESNKKEEKKGGK